MNVTTGRQDDLEQVIVETVVETVIKKILSYGLSKSPDFTSFCENITNSREV
ncbi:hypothetical protein SAMN04488542_12122 [Fontibacillus panacisegetis]|uniref:Uncharacterized protein n=1 Tax=Fontibacillus panacisegetis TaxID=670482 RepID=A0A1G7Q5G4_9BACL|nr:hypothetical protein SAMN04488542_12122 [Fontibacillus panacisegetis]